MQHSQSGRSTGGDSSVPSTVIARLPELLRVLDEAARQGEHTLSSSMLARRIDRGSAMVRKDLSFLGFPGTRGVGYDVAALRLQIANILGRNAERPVALVGMGHLGRALAAYPGFAEQGFRIVAAFDADPALVGRRLSGVVVHDAAELGDVVEAAGIRMAILAVPARAAAGVADRLVASGILSILNFAPVPLAVPDHVHVRRTDLAADLQILAFHARRTAEPVAVMA